MPLPKLSQHGVYGPGKKEYLQGATMQQRRKVRETSEREADQGRLRPAIGCLVCGSDKLVYQPRLVGRAVLTSRDLSSHLIWISESKSSKWNIRT